MRDLTTAYIGLGANLGDACAAVLQAAQEIAALDRVVLTRQSSLYASAPVDAHGPDYVNAVVEVQTRLRAHELLEQLQTIETRAGRLRPYRNAPRTLDLDLLLFGDVRMDSPQLILPHPRMAQRAFVLVPLAEIAPHVVVAGQMQAVQGQTIRKLGVGGAAPAIE
ncbi:MAG: 2-amino-4-hydroxy-6-hydroxymethyldihydropteridine diphosphokinase [Rhodoferax sp.]